MGELLAFWLAVFVVLLLVGLWPSEQEDMDPYGYTSPCEHENLPNPPKETTDETK